MKKFVKKYLHALWFLLFAAVGLAYFGIQQLNLRHHIIHVALDDLIPFVPAFIVPYILWYAFVPAPMIYAFFRDKQLFYRQVATLFTGIFISTALFVLYPSMIDFRPEVTGDGIFEQLCRFIFSKDEPVNVLPSLHCYEATVMYLVTFSRGRLSEKLGARIAYGLGAVVICLSTVFVKQHSVVDLVLGCLMAVLIYSAVDSFFDRRSKNDSKTV